MTPRHLVLATALAALGPAAAGAVGFPTNPFADDPLRLDIPLVEVISFGARGDVGNAVLSFDLGTGATVTGLGWDLDFGVAMPDTSSIGDARFAIGDGATAQVFEPGTEKTDGDPGNVGFSSVLGPVSLLDLSAPFEITSGLMEIEFFERSDDAPGADGWWNGSITVLYQMAPVPLPAGGLLLMGGLGAIGLARRRSRRAA